MTSAVLSILVGQSIQDVSHIIQQGWQNTRPFMTGCLINADDVYSICTGTVIDVGIDDKNNLFSVTVEYNYALWIRYCMLQTCNVSVGDKLATSDKIGSTYKNIVRLEYCTDEFSVFPCRCGDRQLYKHDPMVVFSGEVTLPDIDDPGNIAILDADDDLPEGYIEEDTINVEDE